MNSLNTELHWLYSFFLYWLFPNFILELPKNIEPPALQQGSYKISPVHLPICLSIFLWCIFLRIYSVDFLNFLHEDILPYTKKWQRDNMEDCVCCLDNWVKETNLDQKWNILHFNEANITCFALNDASYWLYEKCMSGKNLLLKL